jgi:hypothetical protein
MFRQRTEHLEVSMSQCPVHPIFRKHRTRRWLAGPLASQQTLINLRAGHTTYLVDVVETIGHLRKQLIFSQITDSFGIGQQRLDEDTP